MEETKKGWICCSRDNAYHGNERVKMVVVDNYEKVKEFIKTNIESIKDAIADHINNGNLSIEKEIIEDGYYFLSLKNNNTNIFENDNCYFILDSFEFSYNIPFNFG